MKKYRALDEHGKELVELVLDKELERVNTQDDSEVCFDRTAFRISEQPAAAGNGVYLGPESFYTVMVRSDALPRNAAFGVPVSGDSMEPKFHDRIHRKTSARRSWHLYDGRPGIRQGTRQ